MLYSGLSKIFNIYGFIENLNYYKYIPSQFYRFIGFAVPLFEVLIGILIWFPYLRTLIMNIYQILITTFIILLIVHFGNYMPFGCGCFGIGNSETITFSTIFRDILLILPAWLYFSLNKWWFK